MLHSVGLSAYFISKIPSDNNSDYNNIPIEDVELDYIDIPPELIGGDKNPAPVEKQEWIEGTSKDKNAISDDKETDVNAVSGDGTDEEGYQLGFKVDRYPEPVIDFDLEDYFPKEARRADITQKSVMLLVKVDETGSLKGARIISDPAGYGFDDAAMKVVKRLRFRPGYLKGNPVKMIFRLPINFILED